MVTNGLATEQTQTKPLRRSLIGSPSALLLLALTAWGCEFSDGSDSDGDDAGANPLPTDSTSGGAGPGGASDPDDDEPTDACDGQVVRLCQDNTVVDRCTSTMVDTEVTACNAECYQGECVDCAPSGFECNGSDRYQRDSCNGSEFVEACEFGCASGSCIDESCQPRASRECVGDLLYSVNSCGDQENVEQVCEGGCTDGTCAGCAEEGATTCFDGDVYGIDSCNQITTRTIDCPETCRTSPDMSPTTECVEASACMMTGGITCALGDIHTTDSCGNVLAEIVEECPNGCDEDGCRPCEPRPVGTDCIADSVYRLMGGCGDAAVPEEEPLEVCEFGCEAGDCLDSDCTPNAGRTCSNGNVHSTDSCGAVGDIVESCDHGCEGAACQDGAAGAGGGGGATQGGGGGTSAGGTAGQSSGGTAGHSAGGSAGQNGGTGGSAAAGAGGAGGTASGGAAGASSGGAAGSAGAAGDGGTSSGGTAGAAGEAGGGSGGANSG